MSLSEIDKYADEFWHALEGLKLRDRQAKERYLLNKTQPPRHLKRLDGPLKI